MNLHKIPLANWKDEYSVGIPHIDEEHKVLLGLIQALETLDGKSSHEMLEKVLFTLGEYCKKHFLSEEVMMKEIGYPQLAEHRRRHREFINKVKDFEEIFHKKGQSRLGPELLTFLKGWLTNHILIHDKAYETFRKDNHIKYPRF